jgi:hypothetical protein
MDEPNCRKSKTDMPEPSSEQPYTLSELPSRAKFRALNPDPTLTNSRTEIWDPRRARPKMLREDPTRLRARRENEEPIVK